MSGYRDTSGYDPFAGNAGRPTRPFNWVQWTGVAAMVLGIAIDLGYFTGRLGWTPALRHGPSFAIVPLMLGVMLVNSRRDPAIDPAPELAAARRRWMLIVVTVCAAILGVAAIFAFKGA